MGSNVTWVDLSKEAELVTFTYVQVTPTSFADHDPYVVAIGRMTEGVNVLAWVEGADPTKLRPGTRLRVEARNDPEGLPYYVFVPA
ncbi:MAG: OB-fold domain-containing protein [Nitrososphaerota archaeon]|nr:OB-fold domain-containing protein [Nitrososphaerota archaeon]MDG6967010.1 OB-fold domain-containing protein [Nitrososphaerota archaeon]MDG6979021.1 OB-fold domain-containing protein [Nitrososphaerota archaeon]MDG7020464.1 OB-fold domain-containing protein [Nitrososphaerota archaeon]